MVSRRTSTKRILLGISAIFIGSSSAARILAEDGCACTLDGISGNVDTGRIGCDQHSPGDATYYCYVVDPSSCDKSESSQAFPGAAWRECRPEGVDGTTTPVASSLLEIVQTRVDLSILADVLEASPEFEQGLQTTDTDQNVTFFAPNNRAWEAAASYLGVTIQELKDSDKLNAILLGHVAFGEYILAGMGGAQQIETLSQSEFPDILVQAIHAPHLDPNTGLSTKMFAVIAEKVYAPNEIGSAIVVADQFAENGVLHVVDAVLAYLPSIPNVAAEYRELSTFVTALERTGLDEELGVSCPTTNGTCSPTPFTVFSPSNAAFAKLASEYNTTVEDILELDGLRDVLLYHVSNPATEEDPISLGSLRSGVEIDVLLPGSEPLVSSVAQETYGCFIPQLCLSKQVVTVEGAQNTATLLETLKPIRAFNGIIHPIDEVLLPPGRLVILPEGEEESTGAGDRAGEEQLTTLSSP